MPKNSTKDRINMLTPIGDAVYPKIQFPDTKFKAEGEYSLKVRVKKSDPAFKAFVKDLEAGDKKLFAEACKKENKKTLKRAQFSPVTDETDEAGKPTGFALIKLSQTAQIKDASGNTIEKTVGVFDAKGNPVPKAVRIGSGSKVRASGELKDYFTPALGYGVKLRLKAVQVLEHVEPSGPSASAYGFAAEADGFDASAVARDNDDDDSGDDDSGDGDF